MSEEGLGGRAELSKGGWAWESHAVRQKQCGSGSSEERGTFFVVKRR